MKNVIISLLAISFLLTSCKEDPEPLIERSTPILEGGWEGFWDDAPDVLVELEIWQPANSDDILFLLVEPNNITHTLVMISDREFDIPDFVDDAGLNKSFKGELINDVLHLDYFINDQSQANSSIMKIGEFTMKL